MARPSNRRRDVPRLSASATAVIVHEDGRQVCIIEDRSPRGARLRVNEALSLPERFALELHPGQLVSARAAWRKADCVGVRFDMLEEPVGFFRQMWRWLGPQRHGAPDGSSAPSSTMGRDA